MGGGGGGVLICESEIKSLSVAIKLFVTKGELTFLTIEIDYTIEITVTFLYKTIQNVFISIQLTRLKPYALHCRK